MRDRAEGSIGINGRDFIFVVKSSKEGGFDYEITEHGRQSWSGTCDDFLEAFDAALDILQAIRDGRQP